MSGKKKILAACCVSMAFMASSQSAGQMKKESALIYRHDKVEYQYNYDGPWETETVHSFKYNSKGDATEIITKTEDFFEKYTIFYHEDGNVAYALLEDREGFSGGYDKVDSTAYFYNNGQMESCIVYEWDYTEAVWEKYEKWENTFENGNLTMELPLKWDDAAGEWINSNSRLKVLSYYDGGNCTHRLTYTWNETANLYVISDSVSFTYQNGILTERTKYKGESRSPYSKNTYLYDSNGNNTKEVQSDWDAVTGAWVEKLNYVIVYNMDILRAETAYSEFEDVETDYIDGRNMPASVIYSYKNDAGQYEMLQRIVYTYSKYGSVDALHFPADGINVYPVPAKDYVVFSNVPENSSLTLIGQDGKVVLCTPAAGQAMVELPQYIPAGNLMFVIKNGKESRSGTIVIIK
jgi:hypothetical protein